jgi:amino-acid N-acetyltransferase
MRPPLLNGVTHTPSLPEAASDAAMGTVSVRGVEASVGPGGQVVMRQAMADDACGIHALISANLSSGHLLPRSLAEITACVSRFRVAVREGELLACGELAHLAPAVAEVRSLVVHESARGLGLGRWIVDDLRRGARVEQYRTLCAFTHDPRFFVRLGFSIVPHAWLPEKIAADCWSCPLFRSCGQYAVVDRARSERQMAGAGERPVS